MSESPSQTKLALVLWNGQVGGAETLNVALAGHLRQLGAEITVVFIESPEPLAERLDGAGIPYLSLGFERGRDVLKHPRRYASAIGRAGPDGALLVERGFIGSALRMGGYRGPIVAVEHGQLLFERRDLTRSRRMLRRISRISGAWAADAEVAVSDFMLEGMRRHTHARLMRRIYNGIDPDVHQPLAEMRADRGAELVVGFAGRLVSGKGADRLIQALAQAGKRIPVNLLIAGDGPERPHLESLAETLGVASRVELCGVVGDLPGFWGRCDVTAIPSDAFESFSMVTLEAMACGMPIVATRNGAIPELIVDGVTGTLVPPGDVGALAQALIAYAEHPELRRAHCASARARAVERFHINACAQAYLDLFGELTTSSTVRGSAPKSGGGR
jgi:glycosyltransferase involved in cell wall biosynthesis